MANHTYRDTLKHPGLQPFLWTQFLGAFNDNLFKIVVSLLAVHMVAAARAGRELSVVSAVFILPFLLFRIPHVPGAAPGRSLDKNPWGEIWAGVVALRRDRVLWLTVIGISYFWFLGSLLQLLVILCGSEVMKLTDTWVSVLTAFAAI